MVSTVNITLQNANWSSPLRISFVTSFPLMSKAEAAVTLEGLFRKNFNDFELQIGVQRGQQD